MTRIVFNDGRDPKVRRLLDLIEAVEMSLAGDPVTVETITRIRKIGTERHAERIIKEIKGTASELGFSVRRVEPDRYLEEKGRWALDFERPESLLEAAQREFDRITGGGHDDRWKRQRERRHLLASHGLCRCKDPIYRGGLCKRHYEEAQERRRRRRREHRELGLCPECNDPATQGIYCKKHAEERNESVALRRRVLVATGLCRECQQPSHGRSYCEACEEKHAAKQQERYEQRRAEGKCGLCGRRPEPGKVLCARCQKRQSESEKRSRAMKERSGLCNKCGKTPPVPGKTRCQVCIDKQRERGLRHYEKVKAAPECVKCRRRPKAEGKIYCTECLEEARVAQARRRGKATNPASFQKYRSLPPDPDHGSPIAQYGPIHAWRLGDYWTVPVQVPLVELDEVEAEAIDESRLESVRSARESGLALPPVELAVWGDGSAWIVDGNHRIVDARRAKLPTIQVIFTWVTPRPKNFAWVEPNPPARGEPLVLYHGTLRRKLPKILRRGLQPSEGWGGANTFGVFLSGTPEGALYWAKLAHQRDKDEKLEVERFDRAYGDRATELLAIVEVTIPPGILHALKADMEQAEDVGFEGEADDWEASLEEIGDVMFDGKIPASWMREISLPGQR